MFSIALSRSAKQRLGRLPDVIVHRLPRRNPCISRLGISTHARVASTNDLLSLEAEQQAVFRFAKPRHILRQHNHGVTALSAHKNRHGRIHLFGSLESRQFSSLSTTEQENTNQSSNNKKKDHESDSDRESVSSAVANVPRQETWATLQRLIDFAKPEHGLVLKSAATLLVTSSSTLILPAVSGHVLDLILSGDPNSGSPALLAAGLFGLTAAAGAGVYARTLWLQKAGNQLTARLKEQLFASILKQEMAFLETQKTGDLVTRLSQDSVLIQQAVTTQSVSVLRAIAMSTGSAVMLFNTSATLAALSLATLPPLFLGARVVGQQLREQQKTVQSLHGKSTTAAEETMSGMTTVVQFGAEKQELARYSDLVQKAHQAAIETGRTQALFDGSVHVAANGAILCVLGYGGSLVMQGSITAGDLTGFLMYSLLLAGNVSSLSSSFTEFSKAVAGFDRIMDIMDRQPAIPSGFNEEKTTTVQHDTPLPVEYRNVDFSYPTRPDEKILDRFTLRVEPGEVLAIVGGSGSGKSTLARLLTRLYDVNGADGEIEDDSSTGIFINNKDIRDWDPVELRQEAIGIVSQEPWLIDASIEENIRYGRPSATDEQVLEAAQLANVVSFTDSFPEGLKTPVGPRGTQLSGGQKQRVAIARLILKDPPIVILDEATSALDAQSEHLVQKAIDSVMKGRTVISIAHRLSTIKGADRIAVLGDGQVLEVGTFEELSRKEDGAFKSLMGRQILTQ